MKTINFLIAAAAVSALTFQGCTDDFNNKTPLPEGTEIQFGAALSDVDGTRTYYGPEVTVGNQTVWPIYWNYEGKRDEIYIYSPQAAAGRNQAKYQVNPDGNDQKSASNIKRLGDVGIQTGNATSNTYDFYALYPASAVTAEANGGVETPTFHATLSGSQSVTFNGTEGNPTTVIPAPATGNIAYLTKPDMTGCLMTAVNADVALEEGKSVNLQFKPFSTVLDITIPGPTDNNTITNQATASITSVEVEANAPISGDFAYNFKTREFTFGANASSTILVNTKGTDAEGNELGIPLQNENTLNLQAFMIPNPAVTTLKVKVYTSDSQVWTKTLNVTPNNYKPTQIHKVVLPKLSFAEATFDYSVWLSQLDPRIYISEISLPGSCLSFNTTANGMTGNMQTQSLDLAAQFNAGVRVFQAHCWIVDGTSSVDGGPTRINLTTSNGGDAKKALYDVLTELQKEMEENHGNEFCVLMLSDYKIEGTKYSFADFYSRFKAITDRLAAEGLLADNVTPNTTIADVKGKIILKLQTNATVDGSGSDGVNNTLSKIQSWSALNGSKALFNWFNTDAQTRLFYAPLQFGGVGSFQFTPGEATYNWGIPTGYKKPVITSYSAGIAYDAALKVINTTTNIGAIVSVGNANCTTKPTSLDNATTMWYMYSEQANPSSTVLNTNIKNVVKSINDTYSQTAHNKFYMTYCGGTGDSSVTTNGRNYWTSAIASVSNKPYGWVLFNEVGTETSTNSVIQKVISNNNDNLFKLARKKTSAQSSPNGDAQPVRPGGSLF